MKLKNFRAYLRGIYNDNDGWRTLNFADQDGDWYYITDVYIDDDDDICLEAGDGCEMSAEEIYNQLRGYDGNSYIYVYATEDDYNFEIEGGWYIDDDDNLMMDMHYHPDYDDDDDDD